MPPYPSQSVQFVGLRDRTLEQVLNVVPPPAVDPAQAFWQLRRIDEYVLDPEMGCGTVVVEKHYIDRDFMEDYSVFYSRSLVPYPNHCVRAHFFRGEPRSVEEELHELVLKSRGLEEREVRRSCEEFSDRSYLGFSVIKPLHGTPVGRTVLRPFPRVVRPTPGESTNGPMERRFHPTRRYRVHLLGAELTVRGLAFQQQDVGVAACATTAVWTSLQKIRDHEEIGVTTPAQITTRATHDRLTFGRSMPSEGLSIDQMCQAVEAFGVSPMLNTVTSFGAARAELYSACRSGFCPVLVINDVRGRHHAIAVAGMKLSQTPERALKMADRAADRVVAVYVHDDRVAPYLRATLVRSGTGLGIKMRTRKASVIKASDGSDRINVASDETEDWDVSHIIVPTHAKIRLSFADLQLIAAETVKYIGSIWQTTNSGKTGLQPRLFYDAWIERSHIYVENLARHDVEFEAQSALAVGATVVLSRYVGVVRTTIPGVGSIDCLVDTTSTRRNLSFLAVVCGQTASGDLRQTASAISAMRGCRAIAC